MKTLNLSNNFASFNKLDIEVEFFKLDFAPGIDYIWSYPFENTDIPTQIKIINPQILVDASTIINAITY